MTNTAAAETFAPMPVWTPEVRMTALGMTREQWAVVDSETVNRRISQLAELREAAARPGSFGSLARSAARLEETLRRNQARCTNSGMLRTACDTCDHSRQLALLAGRV
ncbi:hypothetical protein ACFV16_22220 [Streptomyces massasporeus]|uniref:hypothetical protein n=1 Tax=Streptomyces massasporeus TaxID=67324 RepID=UPI00367751F1